jgi:hypothetical protein
MAIIFAENVGNELLRYEKDDFDDIYPSHSSSDDVMCVEETVKGGLEGKGVRGGGGTPPCRPTPEAHSRRRGCGPAAAGPAGVGAGLNQCESVPIQRLENGCNETFVNVISAIIVL